MEWKLWHMPALNSETGKWEVKVTNADRSQVFEVMQFDSEQEAQEGMKQGYLDSLLPEAAK